MQYDVREIIIKRKLIGYGVFPVDAPHSAKTKPIHSFHIMPGDDGERVAHYLACQMAHDLSANIE